MNFRIFLSPGIGLTLVLMLLAACTTPEPTIQSTSAPTEAPVKWDLIFISDSSGWHVGEKYDEYIERDLGVEVTSHDFALPGLSVRSVLNYFRDPDGFQYNLMLQTLGLADLLPEAEVVVFFANPRSDEMGDWDCVSENPYVVDCSPGTFEAYRADLDAIYDQILALRGDAPLIIRAFDAYNPLYSVFREQGVYEECLGCWENFNQVIHQAATAHNVPVAHVFDAFNGPNHDEDPRDKGLIGPDGIHTREEGSTLIADLLRELGYEYTVSP
jgi:hypothetical protein